MLFYQSKLQPKDFEEKFGNVLTRNELICGNITTPVADLKVDDYANSESHIEKNLRTVTIVDSDTDCVVQIFRNDLVESNRNTYAIAFNAEPGYKIVGIDQRIIANRFWLTDTDFDIIGREFPETYGINNCLAKVYTKNDAGDFIETRFIVKNNEILCENIPHAANDSFTVNVLSKKRFTGFVRAYGNDRFINKVKVPPKTLVYVNKAVTDKYGKDKYLTRYFPGGWDSADCKFIERDFSESESFNEVEAEIKGAIDACETPVFQIYVIGYKFDTTKLLRGIIDKIYADRKKPSANSNKPHRKFQKNRNNSNQKQGHNRKPADSAK